MKAYQKQKVERKKQTLKLYLCTPVKLSAHVFLNDVVREVDVHVINVGPCIQQNSVLTHIQNQRLCRFLPSNKITNTNVQHNNKKKHKKPHPESMLMPFSAIKHNHQHQRSTQKKNTHTKNPFRTNVNAVFCHQTQSKTPMFNTRKHFAYEM
jgi:hypothetical protein